MDLNRATIVGRLTRDPELRTTPSGISVASFSVATNFVWTDSGSGEKKEQVEFHNVVAWRRLGEIIGQYLKKGSRVLIEGRLQTRSWEGQDGVKRYRTEIVAENMIMLDSLGRSGGSDSPSDEPRYEKVPETAGTKQPAPAQTEPEEEEISVDDIPF